VADLFRIALHRAACGDGRRHAADGDGRPEDRREFVIQPDLAGQPETEVEDDGDDQDGLDDPVGAQLDDAAEEDLRAQQNEADLDEVLRLDRRLQPVGYPEQIADDQAEDQGPEDHLQAVVFDDAVFGQEIGHAAEDEDDGKSGDELADRHPHEGHADHPEDQQHDQQFKGFDHVVAGKHLSGRAARAALDVGTQFCGLLLKILVLNRLGCRLVLGRRIGDRLAVLSIQRSLERRGLLLDGGFVFPFRFRRNRFHLGGPTGDHAFKRSAGNPTPLGKRHGESGQRNDENQETDPDRHPVVAFPQNRPVDAFVLLSHKSLPPFIVPIVSITDNQRCMMHLPPCGRL